MENIGQLLKIIRIQKGLTQKDVSNNIMSTQQISNIENNRTNISIHNLVEILKKMNISPGEVYKYLDKDNPQIEFLKDLSHIVHNEDISKLDLFINKYSAIEPSTNNVAIKHNLILLIHYKARFLNSFITDELYSIDIITEYLMRVDPWSLYEINLFLNASPFFESMTRNFLRNHFISSMNTNSTYFNPIRTEVYANQLITSVQILIEEGNYTKAKDMLLSLEELAYNLNNYYVTFRVRFFKGIYLIQTASMEEGKQLAETVIQYFYDLGKESIGKRYASYLDKIINNYKEVESYVTE